MLPGSVGIGMGDRRKTGQPNMTSSSTGSGCHLDGRPPENEEEAIEDKGQAAPGSVGSETSDRLKTGQPKMKSSSTGSGRHLDG